MFVFGKRSISMMEGVRPELILVLSRGLLYSPYDFGITCGMRGWEEHLKNLAAGKSWTEHSKHLRQADGFAWAVDIMAVGDLDRNGIVDTTDKDLTWSREIYTSIYNDGILKASLELGIPTRWGGDWDCDGDSGDQAHFDGPHIELRR